MKNSPHRMKHERQKAIHKAQKEEYETDAKVMKEGGQKKSVTSNNTNTLSLKQSSEKKK